jgi:hypothetical protein
MAAGTGVVGIHRLRVGSSPHRRTIRLSCRIESPPVESLPFLPPPTPRLSFFHPPPPPRCLPLLLSRTRTHARTHARVLVLAACGGAAVGLRRRVETEARMGRQAMDSGSLYRSLSHTCTHTHTHTGMLSIHCMSDRLQRSGFDAARRNRGTDGKTREGECARPSRPAAAPPRRPDTVCA